MVDFKELAKKNKKNKEWLDTDIGKAFRKYENAMANYWANDLSETISDKRLRELDDVMRKAKAEFLILIRGW